MSTVAAPRVPVLPAPDAVMAKARHENFPVASRMLPRRERGHLLALYGFARLVDDVGDEVAGDRRALLDCLEEEVDRIYAGAEPTSPIMRRLARTARACALPDAPLRDLIEANRRDQVVHDYPTYAHLLDACALSANPVGRLVLHVVGAATPDREVLSDAVCTGLQLVEHWQDVAEDLRRGRVYLPAEDLERFRCTPDELTIAPPPGRVRRLLAFEVARARALLDAGAPLVARLHGRPALAVAAFVAGGRAAAGAIERAGYDVTAGAPRATRPVRAAALLTTLVRQGRR